MPISFGREAPKFHTFQHNGRQYMQISQEIPKPQKQPLCGRLDGFVCSLGKRVIQPLAFAASAVLAVREFEAGRALLATAANEIATAGHLLVDVISERLHEAAPYAAPVLSAIWAVPSVVRALANKQWKRAAFYATIGTLTGAAPHLARI